MLFELRIKTKEASAALGRALRFGVGYAAWALLFRLLVLTFVTYFMISSQQGKYTSFDEISEAFASNEVGMMGLCAAFFLLGLLALRPLTTTTWPEIFTRERIEKRFVPGFLHGGILAFSLAFVFVISGACRYLGIFMQFDEAPISILSVGVRTAAILILVYCEEFVFRQKIMQSLRDAFRGSRGDMIAAIITAATFCLVKRIQFDLGVMQLLTLFLLSLSLSVRAIAYGDFGWGAGFWAALLIVFQPLLSLPVLGSDFSGLLLVKYQPLDTGGALGFMTRLLSGGLGGPLSGFALQLVLVLDIVRATLRYKKILPNPRRE